MSDPDPMLERLRAARPALPGALRARALAAGRTAWTPWWRRLSTWAAAAAAVLMLDAAVLAAGAPPPSRPHTDEPPVMAIVDDPDIDIWARHRMAFAQSVQRQRLSQAHGDFRRQTITDIMENSL